MRPRLISVNVGLPRDIDWYGKKVHTAIWKTPVSGRVNVNRMNLEGDGQGDLAGHGGEQRAVMVYQLDSYRYWERELRRDNFSFGQFGENFTVEGMADDEVCIGDRYRIGTAMFEATQPRVTCYRVGIRMDEPRMAALLVAHHRPGFYFRVIEEGAVEAGDEILKVSDGPERITVSAIDALLYLPGRNRQAIECALRIPALSKGWKGSFEALLAETSEESGNAGLKASSPPPAWVGFRPMRVVKKNRECEGVVSLTFAASDGATMPAPIPGQFVVVKLPVEAGRPSILRSYSISGRPEADSYRVSVKRVPKGIASTIVHEQIAIGDMIEMSAPRGAFLLKPRSGPVVFMSAGIGVTPVLAMLQQLAAEASLREVWWLYAARNRNEHPFAEDARTLLGKLAGSKSFIVYSQPAPDDRSLGYCDAVGHFDAAVLSRLEVPQDAEFYLCGPSKFMEEMAAYLHNRKIPAGNIHTETFGSEPGVTPGIANAAQVAAHPPTNAPVGDGANVPSITFIRSGLTVTWQSRFQSLLELAEACDVPVKWSCRMGVCHTCECALIDGATDYSPDPLDPPTNGNVLLCCSRPRTDIELDL